jgi:type IV pilus assembly protein PilB
MDGPRLSFDDMASVGLSEVDIDAIGGDEAGRRDGQDRDDEIDLGASAKSSEAAPVIKLSNVLLIDALKRGASDIHIEPYEKEFRVRFRIDGILYNVMALPMKLRDPLISRLKIMAKLDISEKRLPQDGRIKIRLKIEDRSRDMDFRVSCLPTIWGEKVVLRLLDKTKLMLDMTKLGFEPEPLERFKRAISKPYGIVLVTGPTGSGKTNTLYSAIAPLNKPDTNIMTAEDPSSSTCRHQPGPDQGPDRPQLRLRPALVPAPGPEHHPGGRDPRLRDGGDRGQGRAHRPPRALHPAHQRRAVTVSRLVNMGIEPFLVGTAVNLIQAQRLIRRICAQCKEEMKDVPARPSSTSASRPSRWGPSSSTRARLRRVQRHGLQGRVGPLRGHGDLRRHPRHHHVGGTAVEIKRKALEEGMLTLRMSGLEKIKNGVTTIEKCWETCLTPRASRRRSTWGQGGRRTVTVSPRSSSGTSAFTSCSRR